MASDMTPTPPAEELGAKQADEYAAKHWSGDDYTAAFDSYIAGYQAALAALTPQPTADAVALVDALIDAAGYAADGRMGYDKECEAARAAVLAAMRGTTTPTDSKKEK